MKLTVELDLEEDGRYIAEVLELPGVMVYGDTPEQALAKVQVLALRVLADKLEGGEFPETPLTVLVRDCVRGVSHTRARGAAPHRLGSDEAARLAPHARA